MANSSAGLLMLSQNTLDADTFPNVEPTQNDIANKRKRHKSAGDYFNKPRSNSVFSSWRPRHISGDPSVTGGSRLPDLLAKDLLSDDDAFIEETEKNLNSDDLILSKDTADSGVIVEETNCEPSSDSILNSDNSVNSKDCDGINTSDPGSEGDSSEKKAAERPNSMELSKPCDIPKRKSSPLEGSNPLLSPHSYGTPVTSNDPLGLFNPPKENNLQGKEKKVEVVVQPIDIMNDEALTVREIVPGGNKCNTEEGGETNFILGSGYSLDNYSSATSDSQPLSPMEKIGKRLKEVGRTNSSPGNLDSQMEKSSWFKPVTGYLKSFQSPQKKSLESLDEVGQNSPGSESRLASKRLGSFKKQERLSGALKFMTSKFNEIKQTISTPLKYGSNSSLTKSEEEGADGAQRQGMDVPRRAGSVDHTAYRAHLTEDTLGKYQ